jgi:crotonobetainyl-CoA:carnitine CoA-transferase CaiB-like acyl-CoA transferase
MKYLRRSKEPTNGFRRYTEKTSTKPKGALSHIRVLDLSRVLAGPWATQYLADLGADVIKVELPKIGDDTRGWGPPFLEDVSKGEPSKESAYYLGANRGKRSITVDMAKEEGQDLLRRLAASSDVVIENFKVGGLKKYGLDYDSLKAKNPKIIYASISGFGQEGPRAHQAGYDFAIQAMGGLMSITGEREGIPLKVGVAVTDIMTGMYTVSGILSALIYRDQTGIGQYIDNSLFDTQLAFLANQGMNFLVGGKSPSKIGNQHPNIVPYSTFQTKTGHIVVTVGNDGQFRQLCQILNLPPHIASDERFATNSKRVAHKNELYAILDEEFKKYTREHFLTVLNTTSIPHSPVNSIEEAFNDPQAKARGATVTMQHPLNPNLKLIANPSRFSETPVNYELPPPMLGQHTDEVLSEILQLSPTEIETLRTKGVV